MRTPSKDVKKQKTKKTKNVKNKAIKDSNQWLNCPHGSLIIRQMFQRAVCKSSHDDTTELNTIN